MLTHTHSAAALASAPEAEALFRPAVTAPAVEGVEGEEALLSTPSPGFATRFATALSAAATFPVPFTVETVPACLGEVSAGVRAGGACVQGQGGLGLCFFVCLLTATCRAKF
jgi:hypothetical protein